MSSNFGEIVKKLIPVFGKKPARGLPSTDPGVGDSHTWRNAKLSRQNTKSGGQNEMSRVWEEGGKFCHFSNNSRTEKYFKMLLSHRGVYRVVT